MKYRLLRCEIDTGQLNFHWHKMTQMHSLWRAVGLSVAIGFLLPRLLLGQAATSEAGDGVPEPAKTAILPSAPPELHVKRAKTGHLLVCPQINGKDAGWFIFDTGAGMSCVDKRVIERLGLPDAGAASARGARGTQSTRLRRVESLALGPVLLENSTVVELDLTPIGAAMGEQIDGVIGYECFRAGVLEVDLDAGRIVVHDRASYALPDGAQWQKLAFLARRPHLHGKIEDNPEGLYLIDIGANSSITVNAPTVQRLSLLEARETRASMSGGVGGIHAARTGDVSSFQIAGKHVTDVQAVFSQAQKGALADDDVQGSVGVGLLKRFVLVLDYQAESVALLPRP